MGAATCMLKLRTAFCLVIASQAPGALSSAWILPVPCAFGTVAIWGNAMQPSDFESDDKTNRRGGPRYECRGVHEWYLQTVRLAGSSSA